MPGQFNQVCLGAGRAAAFIVVLSLAAPWPAQAQRPKDPRDAVAPTEAALLDQIKCEKPPQASPAMLAMLRNRLVRRTKFGMDGVEIVLPTRPLHLLGLEIVRIAGWQAGENGDAMRPFWRGPGTAPPEHIAVTVRASAQDVHKELARRGIKEGRYVPILSDPTGNTRRLTPGPLVRAGDYDGGVFPKLPGVTTIECYATDFYF